MESVIIVMRVEMVFRRVHLMVIKGNHLFSQVRDLLDLIVYEKSWFCFINVILMIVFLNWFVLFLFCFTLIIRSGLPSFNIWTLIDRMAIRRLTSNIINELYLVSHFILESNVLLTCKDLKEVISVDRRRL
jgi:hypothetical protein